MSGKNRCRDLCDVLTGWVEEIRATGGVSDCGYETLDAISATTKLCWAIHFENGYDHNEMTQLGIKWVASFTVSCAKHGTGDLRAIARMAATVRLYSGPKREKTGAWWRPF